MLNIGNALKKNGLVYSSDSKPGFYRKKKKNGFLYTDKNRNKIKDAKHLKRIKKLVLPPAWSAVWICASPNGYLQATGKDAAGRKQYKYHPKWVNDQSSYKFYRLLEFGQKLPLLRKQVKKDLLQKELTQQKVTAICIDLLQKTLIRVGNKSYCNQYGTFGLTTLRNKHIKFDENILELNFIGKKGVKQHLKLKDPILTELIKECKKIPGYNLFQYYDSSKLPKKIDAQQINDYIKKVCGNGFTAKNFRTWGATLEALIQFANISNEEKKYSPKMELEVLDRVAEKLGNTRAVCKSSYIYPGLFDEFRKNGLAKWLNKVELKSADDFKKYIKNEEVLLSFLKSQDAYKK